MISSRESFAAFVENGYRSLSAVGVSDLSAPVNLSALYDWAADYNPLHLEPKQELAGQELDRVMAEYVDATVPHKIVMQADPDWIDLTDDVDVLLAYYATRAAGEPIEPVAGAADLTGAYLHVYPRMPNDANWRIGVNVEPRDMASAMERFTPLLDHYPGIDHIKFLGPGYAGKADSVIVYLKREEATYAALRDAVLEAAEPLARQARVGAMWNEIRDGIGEASEPPLSGVSFTQYRVIVFYLAYMEYREAYPQATFEGFQDYLSQAMELFGLDVEAPYTQGPLLIGNPLFESWWRSFNTLLRAWTEA